MRLVQTAVTRRCMTDNSVLGADIALSIDEALRAITINAARHMGLGDMTGSLETGQAGRSRRSSPATPTSLIPNSSWTSR